MAPDYSLTTSSLAQEDHPLEMSESEDIYRLEVEETDNLGHQKYGNWDIKNMKVGTWKMSIEA